MSPDNKEQFVVDLKDIYIPMRFRKDLGDIQGLMKSMASIEQLTGQGLIQPLVLMEGSQEEGKSYTLVAGGRRMHALLLAGKGEAPATLRKNVTELGMRAMELEENLARKNMTWAEESALVEELDRLKKGEHGEGLAGPGEKTGWHTQDTATLTGKTAGHVGKQIKMAKALRERPELKEKLEALPFVAAYKNLGQLEKEADLKRQKAQGVLKTTSSLQHRDAIEGMGDLRDESVDLVVTDPPFGNTDIESGKTASKSRTSVVYQQRIKESDNMGEQEMKELMEKAAVEMFRVMKPGAHLYLFHTCEHQCWLKRTLRKAGFDVGHMPIIWDKGKAVSVFTGYTYPSSYEPVLFCFKPPRVRRLTEPHRNVLQVAPTGVDTRVHAFQKPSDLLKVFVVSSSLEGELVMDPFAGSGSTLKAAMSLGRSALGFELDEDNYLRAQEWLTEGAK